MKTRVVILVEVDGFPVGTSFGPSGLTIPGIMDAEALKGQAVEVRAVDAATGKKIVGYPLDDKKATPEETAFLRKMAGELGIELQPKA